MTWLSDHVAASRLREESGGSGGYIKPVGGIPSTDLASAVQTNLTLASSALQAIAASSVDSSKIADGGVSLVDLASAVQTSLGKADSALQTIATGSIGSTQLTDGGVALADLSSTVQTSLGHADTALQSIAAGSIGSTQIATGSIGTTQLADGGVGLVDLATGVQTSLGKADSALQSIGTGAVGSTQIATDAVGSTQIADGSVALADLVSAVQTSLGKADSALQSIAANAVTSSMILDGTIVAGDLASSVSSLLPLSPVYTIRQHATNSLPTDTNLNKLFSGSTNGRLTLPVGTYRFEAFVSLSGLSATSGNALFSLIGAGNAVLANQLMEAWGIDGSGAAASITGSITIGASATPASMLVAGVNTSLQAAVIGTFEVTTAGTLVPSMQQANTPTAAVLAAGSYFRCWKIGETTDVALPSGSWD